MIKLQIYWILIYIYLYLHLSFGIYASKFNVTYKDLANCKEYQVNSSEYLKFFKIDHLSKGTTQEKTEVLRLKFYVLAARDAHLLLTSTDQPSISDRVYEIVIGAGSNTFSELRENLKTRRLVTVIESNIVSILDATPIYIVQQIDGTISVSIPGLMKDPLLSYKDKNPIVVNYVSFSSFGKSLAKWFYDCKEDIDEETIKMEDQMLTDVERVSIDIFLNYSDSRPPINLTQIKFGFIVNKVKYDHAAGIFSTQQEMKFYWTDNRLQWDPANYGNVTFIESPFFPIWNVQVKIFNGAKETFKEFSPYSVTIIHSNGSIEILLQIVEIDSWCFNGSLNWPNDDTVCEILIGLDIKEDDIRLVHDKSSTLDNKNGNQLFEWSLQHILITDVHQKLPNGDDQFLMSLKFNLSRNSAYYKIVFYIPAYASCIILLLSFCLDGKYRGTLNLLSVLVTLVAFLNIVKHAPITYIPTIITHYQTLLLTGSISYILHTAFTWIVTYPPKRIPPIWIISILKYYPLQFVLGLRLTNSVDFLRFEKHPWMELVNILNRIVFIPITIFYIIIFFA